MHVVSMLNVILTFLLINPVNGLAFVCLSFHFMMVGLSYELSPSHFFAPIVKARNSTIG